MCTFAGLWSPCGDLVEGLGTEQPLSTVGTLFDFNVMCHVRFAAASALDVSLDAPDTFRATGGTGFDD